MPNPCELCHQQMLELLPPRDASTQLSEAQSADETLRAEMEAHLATCSDCTREWTRLQNMTQALHSIPMVSAPIDLRARIRSQIVDEQTAKKSFWQSLTWRPQRVAWAGSVVVGGLLFALATQQPIEFGSSVSSPTASSGPFDVAQEAESSLRIEEKIKKPAPKVVDQPEATKNSKPRATTAPSRATAPTGSSAPTGTSAPDAINSAANNLVSADATSDTNTSPDASPKLRPAPPATIPSMPVLPPSELRPAPPSTPTRPRNQSQRPSPRPSVEPPATPKTSNRRDASTQKPGGQSAKLPSVAPRNSVPELFSDTKPVTQPASPKKAVTPPQPQKPNFGNDSAFSAGATMAQSAPETREGTQNAARESEPKTASSPSALEPAETGPSTRARSGISATRSVPAADNQRSAAGSAPENFAIHNETAAASKQRVVVVATRFIPSRDVKTARLRIVLPTGATLASPSTQDLVVWQGRARAGIAIPLDIPVRTELDSGSLRLMLEEKRGSTWRNVQERTIALEP